MSTYKSHYDKAQKKRIITEDDLMASGGDGTCSVCGGLARAYWLEHKAIEICHKCAIRKLPKLIADATTPPETNSAHTLWDKCAVSFWEAVASSYCFCDKNPLNIN